MGELTERLLDGHDRRMDLRRRMMAHLGLDPSEEEAPALFAPLRQTLLICTRCTNPDACAAWLALGHPGAPVFCRARGAFEALAEATPRARPAVPRSAPTGVTQRA